MSDFDEKRSLGHQSTLAIFFYLFGIGDIKGAASIGLFGKPNSFRRRLIRRFRRARDPDDLGGFTDNFRIRSRVFRKLDARYEKLHAQSAKETSGMWMFDDCAINQDDSVLRDVRIIVQTEADKEQLLLASKYFDDMIDVDPEYIAVSFFARIHRLPNMVEVEQAPVPTRVMPSFPGPSPKCGCLRCVRDRKDKISGWPAEMMQMIICSSCGNKRCPHATDHDLACSNSNEPGQKGSRYE